MKLTSFCHVGAWQVKDFIFFHCQPPEGIVLPIGGFLPDVFVEIFSRERTVVVLSVDQIRQVGLKFFAMSICVIFLATQSQLSSGAASP